MTCSPKLHCNISDKNTNIGSDIVLFLGYESMCILPLNLFYSSTENLSMIIPNKIYVFTLKDFSSFSYMIVHSYLLCFLANIFTLSPLAYHIFHKY